MMDTNLGHSASTARPWAVRLEALPMSKAERLHRWADNLELRKQLARSGDAASRKRGGSTTRAGGSPLRVAFDDWAFQAEGLREGNALSFFDLSADEMKRIVSTTDGASTNAAAAAAARVRALAEQAESTTAPQVGVLLTSLSVAVALGLVFLAS